MIRRVTGPQSYMLIDAKNQFYPLLLDADSLIRQPGGAIKYLRRKSQEYLDPQGDLMVPRPKVLSYWDQIKLLADMLRANDD